jgi:hypothetical protein
MIRQVISLTARAQARAGQFGGGQGDQVQLARLDAGVGAGGVAVFALDPNARRRQAILIAESSTGSAASSPR